MQQKKRDGKISRKITETKTRGKIRVESSAKEMTDSSNITKLFVCYFQMHSVRGLTGFSTLKRKANSNKNTNDVDLQTVYLQTTE